MRVRISLECDDESAEFNSDGFRISNYDGEAEQVAAALGRCTKDAWEWLNRRRKGLIAPQVMVDESLPEGTIVAVSPCPCGHGAESHGPDGCRATLHYSTSPTIPCKCTTPFDSLAVMVKNVKFGQEAKS